MFLAMLWRRNGKQTNKNENKKYHKNKKRFSPLP
jgi:hypothetical protein